MALIKSRPTSPGRRFQVAISRSHLHKGGPEQSLVVAKHRTGARNHSGRQTVRHQGGGHKQRYRLVDFLRDKDGIAGKVLRIEYDPNRTAHLALIQYADGERRYIIAPKGVTAGDAIMSGQEAPIKSGNAMSLRHVPVGSLIHNVEMKPGRGGQLARSAGSSVSFTAREGIYAYLRLKSGETRKVHIDCRATIGEVGNDEHNLRSYGKAGAKRWKGVRPTVRGLAMNPVDHPHGGGEGKSGQGNPHPVSPWGWNTKGLKTRHNKRTDNMIVQRRKNRIRNAGPVGHRPEIDDPRTPPRKLRGERVHDPDGFHFEFVVDARRPTFAAALVFARVRVRHSPRLPHCGRLGLNLG